MHLCMCIHTHIIAIFDQPVQPVITFVSVDVTAPNLMMLLMADDGGALCKLISETSMNVSISRIIVSR